MKKAQKWYVAMLLCVLGMLLFAPVTACAANTVLFSITTSTTPESVMLMDDAGQSLSTVVDMQTVNDQKVWMLNITDNGAQTAYLYQKDASGNWLRTNISYPMDMLFTAGSAAQDSTAAWPQSPYTRHTVYAYPLADDKRVQSRCGPEKSYHGAGAYKTYKMTSTEALFIEGNYMLVDLSYTTVGRRCVYFRLSDFYGYEYVPEANLTGISAKTTEKLTPMFGPGKSYDSFDEAIIPAGTTLSVFFEENGWVFAEFDCDLGYVRAWIPVSQVAKQ